ncbi:metallophosphoesterase family protein [Agrobacterium rubi]|uniref:Metallophosphoesterase n=1 Tax=Agrobacterium rubi TaxID=28099 RepID=A0AAE7R6Q1_9HYPH|nr:metallophosphoesterase [Agrobacterium rubi]NTE88276.1 metallophosphoesterase [Agrobacterium rubi]NTF04042.1 metallophosphoesterase [Agrobacterium rubi]NTF38373.1 metallophosphoesterase [Agrobacterium rubi]OCJ47063.1 hypothetical protein A6U92_12780 [Agrobacterium rubi]QTG02189.1 metallophosphoesterase [Agrobacterium rubi]
MQIAVVADVHLHDLYGGYGILEEASGEVALRTLDDTMASTRVFNESYPAFLAVLNDIVKRGIRDVVLLGDYSDDGQMGAVAALKKVLSSFEDNHGMRFFVTFGNHDCFGPEPRHHAKWLTKADGLHPVLVTSDDHAQAPMVVRSGMLGMSTAAAVAAMSCYGIERPLGVAHWETPFCNRGGQEHRRFQDDDPIGLDASYLVEPQDCLWLLMLDANVFHEHGGTWKLQSDAAWDYVLAERSYILEWISDVAKRATLLGKTLLAFSHYPVLPLALTGNGDDLRSACTPDWQARMPSLKSSRLLAEAGLRWHFSGHMHVAGRTELDGLVNLAVPSPVAYPGGYIVVAIDDGVVSPETVLLNETVGFDIGFSAYENQIAGADKLNGTSILACSTYPEFLLAHLLHLAATKHIPNDWQPDLLGHLDRPMAHLFSGDAGLSPILEKWQSVASQPFRIMMEDYYILRAGGQAARQDIPADRCNFYRELAHTPDACGPGEGYSAGHVFLEMFFACFAVSRTGSVTP